MLASSAPADTCSVFLTRSLFDWEPGLVLSGIASPAAVKSDITTAQTVSLGSLEQFREFYLKAIKLVMRDLKEMADRNREPPPGSEGAPVRDQLSKLCILTYVSGMGNDDVAGVDRSDRAVLLPGPAR
jgi:hypothetical protein